MGFVLLLMVSLSMMTATFSASSATGKLQLAARQNAMIGLYAALGQLQSELGPDQRISARADLTDGIANPYWTGVWDNDGIQRTWLVSGNNTTSPLAYAADTDLPDGVELASDGTNTVRAPRVEISDEGATGAYAYWVGDEGIKAKASMASAGAVTNAALISPSAFGVGQMLGMDWYRSEDPLAGRLFEDGQLELLESQWKAPDVAQGATTARFHDLTVYGYGVISDTRDGGLRRDLAAGLEEGAIEPAGQIFGPVESAAISSDDPGGPLWQQLRSWANSVQPNGELPVRGATDTQTGYYPVVTTFQVYLLPTYDPTDSNKVYFHVMPVVTIWNPYDRTLEEADYKVLFTRTLLVNKSGGGLGLMLPNWHLLLQTDDNGNYETKKDKSFSTGRTDYVLQMQNEPFVFNLRNVSLAPGEIRVFSPSGNAYYDAGQTSMANVLSSGYSAGGSFFYPVGQIGTHRELYMGTDEEGNPAPLTGYKYELQPQRVVSLVLYRSDGTGGDEFLTESSYLNAVPESGSNPPAANMSPYAISTSPRLTTAQRDMAIGLKFTRVFVDNTFPLLPKYRTKWLTNANPRAATNGPNPMYYSGSNYSTYSTYPSNNPSYISTMLIDGSLMSPGTPGVGLNNDGGVDQTVLFEAPESPENIYSVGELMHAPLYYWHNPSGNFNEVARVEERFRYGHFDNLIPAYAVGNSQADPRIELGQTYRLWSDYPNTHHSDNQYFNFDGRHYDYSYLLNDALWDSYFFSSWENNGLPENPRMSVIDDTALTGPDYRESAANLMIDGAFNINSTSVEAWKALLASFYGEQVQKADGSNDNNAEASPVLRFREPVGSEQGNGDANDDEAYLGYKALDAGEIQDLAEAIVTLVKERGPFTSLAEFINRTLEDDANTPEDDRLRGLLAQALLDADINSAMEDYDAVPSDRSGFNTTAGEGWRTEDIPGWLSQADLLARLGSVLSARSDTFRIRCYGEAKDPMSDQVVGTAWCEAIVQRFPEYIDATNVAYTPMDEDEATAAGLAALTQENQSFGRRFKIVAFRWLTPDEI